MPTPAAPVEPTPTAEAYAAEVIAAAPPLSEEQRRQLAAILRRPRR